MMKRKLLTSLFNLLLSSGPRAHGTLWTARGTLLRIPESTTTTVITWIWMIEQDVSLAPLIPKDCKVVKIQCARPCHLYQINTEETTLVQVRSCLLLRSGHLWQEMWQLFCSG